MVATSAVPNRIAPYLSEPAKTLPALPADPAARRAVLSDAVFAAVLALQAQLVHHDPKIVQAAAGMILNFEMTRLRHGRPVAGTADECGPHTACAGPEEPHTPCADHTPDDLPAEPDDGQIEAVRKSFQKRADAAGTGEVVSWEQAKQAARDGLALIRGGMHEYRRAAGTTEEKPCVRGTGGPPVIPTVWG